LNAVAISDGQEIRGKVMDQAQVPNVIPELLKWRARRSLHSVASYFRTGGGPWVSVTWGELQAEVEQVAVAFRRMGLERGDRLAIWARACREWQVAEMAGLLVGAVIVGIDDHLTGDQAEFVLNHSGTCCLLVDAPGKLEKLPPRVQARLKFATLLEEGTGLGGGDRTRLCRESIRREGDGGTAYNGSPAPADPATLIYTAGTTGTPKGIEYTHAQLMTACGAIVGAFPQLAEADSTLCWLPMAHLFQRMLNLVAMACGMTTYFVEDPRDIMECLRTVQPSFFAAVPRFLDKLAQSLRENPKREEEWRQVIAPKVKFLLSGSAPIDPRLLHYFQQLGILVLEAYGVSENTVPVAANRLDAYRFGSVGKPFPTNLLRVAADGEVLVKGPGLFRGYYRQEPPPEQFTPDGFYRTGDLGRLDEDGFLYLLGRKAEFIKTSTGRRIFPAGVEAIYRQSCYVDQIVVFGDGRKHLVGLVTLNAGTSREALARMGKPSPPDEKLVCSSVVKELIRCEMHNLSENLAPYEWVLAVAILPRPLSVASGELTPTLKLRRNLIAARYGDLIKRLYELGPGAVISVTDEDNREERR
jgi:long-chain acyl-CoA synthetase